MIDKLNTSNEKLLLESSEMIKSFNDFGLEVWIMRLRQYENNTADLPSNLLFRQILEAGDGIYELMKAGCINSCKPLLRMALDCYLQFAFLLEKDEQNRALHFLYHYNRNKLDSLEKVLFPEKENSLTKKIQNDLVMNEFALSEAEREMALKDYKTLQEILNSNENTDIAKEYGKKKRQKWYQYFIDASTIEGLAKSLKRSAMYEIPFRMLSSFIHGEDILHSNMEFYEGGKVGIKSLRDISQLDFCVMNTIIILRASIFIFIQKKMNSDRQLLFKLREITDKEREFRDREFKQQ